MEEPMRKTKKQKRPKSTDTLLKTSKKKDIELTEEELDKVSGGATLTLNFSKFNAKYTPQSD
jgi:bacteriocin-like protein